MLNKKIFDMEYSTQNRKEVDFLKENNISVYKYTKNKQLFEALSMFYK